MRVCPDAGPLEQEKLIAKLRAEDDKRNEDYKVGSLRYSMVA